jgi:hypothetical protein
VFTARPGGGGGSQGIIGAQPPNPIGTVNPSSVSFGDVPVGQTFTQALTITNTGNADLQVTQATLSGSTSITLAGLTVPLTISPGQTVSFSAQFAPTATGAASATLAFTSNSSTAMSAIALSGNGITPAPAQLSANPVAIDFGSAIVGNPATQTLNLTNTGGAQVIVSAITAAGTGFSIVSPPALPFTLATGQTQAMTLQFAPTAAGAASGSVSVTSDAPNSPNLVSLTGTGVAATQVLNLSPTSLDFGIVFLGQSATQTVTMTNTGNSSVSVTAANVTGAGYSITPPLALPATLGPGQSQNFTLQFAPSASGVAAGSVSLVSNASNSPTAVALTGTGQAQLLQLTVNPSSIDFGDVTVGSTDARAVSVTNTGNSNVTITAATASGTGFSVTGLTTPLTLTPGQATSFTALFAPTSVASGLTGSISLTSNATSPASVTLSGNGVPVPVLTLDANPVSLNYGDVVVGNTDVRSVTLTNTGNTNITVNTATVSGAAFSIAGLSLPSTLSPGQTLAFTAQFAPTAAGAASGTITVASTAANSPATVTLQGNGIAAAAVLQATPSSITFGSIIVGSSQSQLVTLTNTGNVTATITSATLTGAEFSFVGLTTPLSLTPGQSTTFSVVFTPAAAGNPGGSLSLISNATNSPTNITFSGTGVAQTRTLVLNPSSVGFGDVVVGSSSTQAVQVTNTGNSSVTITSVTPSGAPFNATGLATPVTLAAGQTASFSVQFSPTVVASNQAGSVTLISDATNSPTAVSLIGNGISAPVPGFLSVASSFDFGSVIVTAPPSVNTFTMTNTGGSPVNITSVSLTGGAAGFSTSLTAPLTLNAGASTTFTAQFAPVAPGPAAGSITITSDASNSPTAIALTGTGVAAVLELNVSPSSLNFGGVIVGSNTSQTVTMANAGNLNLTVTAANFSTGAVFSINPPLALPLTLTPGQSQNFTVLFAPSAAGSVSDTLTLVSNDSTPPTLALSGNGIAQVLTLGLNPTSIDFGSILVGSNITRSVTVTNTGNTSVTITSASTISPPGAGFSFTGLTLPLTLSPGQSATFNASFAPTAAGTFTGSISLLSNASNSPTSVALAGTGVPVVNTLTANPSSINFGNVFTGSTDTRTVTLTNSGNVNITINTATPSGAGFSLTGLTLPLTLTPGQSTTFSAHFSPASAGAVSGSILIGSTAANSPTTISLSGTGVTPVATLAASPSSIDFGNLFTGTSQTQSVTLTNTGNVNVSVSGSTVTGAGFSISGLTTPITLTPGQTTSFTVQFAPTAAGAVTGNVSVTSTATNSPTVVSLSGTGVTPTTLLSASPSSISFGSVFVGNSTSQSVTLTNTGNTNVTVSSVTATGAGFSVSGISLPLTLTPGQTSTFSVQFLPAAAGAVTGSVSVVSNATNSPATVTLSGDGQAGAPAIAVNPSSLNFGSVIVNSSNSQIIQISNTGNQPLTVTAAAVSGAGFSITGLTLPLTIDPGQSATFQAVFTPASAASFTGSITITSDAPTSPSTVALSGTGSSGVSLTWDASVTPGLAGYRVYRSTTSGSGYVLLNPSLVLGTTFVDSSAAPGTTYFYIATSVDPAGFESGSSNELRVTVP